MENAGPWRTVQGHWIKLSRPRQANETVCERGKEEGKKKKISRREQDGCNERIYVYLSRGKALRAGSTGHTGCLVGVTVNGFYGCGNAILGFCWETGARGGRGGISSFSARAGSGDFDLIPRFISLLVFSTLLLREARQSRVCMHLPYVCMYVCIVVRST